MNKPKLTKSRRAEVEEEEEEEEGGGGRGGGGRGGGEEEDDEEKELRCTELQTKFLSICLEVYVLQPCFNLNL